MRDKVYGDTGHQKRITENWAPTWFGETALPRKTTALDVVIEPQSPQWSNFYTGDLCSFPISY